MKKLLLLLLCVPLLFSNCNKDEDTPGNNNGTSTFLENQDGTVWVNQNTGQQSPGVDAIFAHSVKIGLYNEVVWLINETGNVNGCYGISAGVGCGMIISIITNTINELHFEFTGDPGEHWSYKLTTTSASSNQMNIECKFSEGGLVYEDNMLFIKSSTETNLSCN